MSHTSPSYQFETDYLRISLNTSGALTSITDLSDGAEYLPQGQTASLLQLAIDGQMTMPEGMDYDTENHHITLTYATNVTASVSVRTCPTHLTFELITGSGAHPSHLQWGPFPTTIDQTIGETVGVVRNDRFALGIQALNIHTIGGYPEEYAHIGAGEINDAAAATDYGSVLQAYSRDTDGGIKGSKIALFGCPEADALNTISRIEVDEGLPHPILDGEWVKTARTTRVSYLITGFREDNIEDAIRYTEMAGFNYFYHEDPFETWGHFKLKSNDFPNGDDGLKECVSKAAEAGQRIGIHTLSNFMTTNDPYVTPIPDARLMRSGFSSLAQQVDTGTMEIAVDDPVPFQDRGTVSAAVIEDEIIRYRAVSDDAPWRLLGCRRGAFGTTPASHASGTEIGKLADHPYRVFFPNLSLQDDMADRLVELFNHTGLRQISFDGLEGCAMTGHGMYAHNRFVMRCFDGWQPEVLNDASRLTHYLWHTHTRMNWGEPWRKPTREGQIGHRLKNQAYFQRNLFPRMFGWFQLRLASGGLEATSLDDMEWVLSKCAGYDAGFALSAGLEELQGNGQTDTILKAVKEWETARLDHAFTPQQAEQLREPSEDFHLEPEGQGQWNLYPVAFSPVHIYSEETLQPGEPGEAEWTFENPFDNQPFQFTIRVLPDVGTREDATVVNPTFEVNFQEVTLPVSLEPYEYLICAGDGTCRICDINWNEIHTIDLSDEWPEMNRGDNQILFWFGESSSCSVEVKFKAVGPVESVGA